MCLVAELIFVHIQQIFNSQAGITAPFVIKSTTEPFNVLRELIQISNNHVG